MSDQIVPGFKLGQRVYHVHSPVFGEVIKMEWWGTSWEVVVRVDPSFPAKDYPQRELSGGHLDFRPQGP